MNLGIIILAGGNSSRMGSPKQLLAFDGSTLLQRTIAAAAATGFTPIVLVLGAYASEIIAKNSEISINVTINDNWQQGISTSITAGLSKLLELEPEMQNVIIAVSDQPFISSQLFTSIAEKSIQSGKNIVASTYNQTIGTPALFNKKYFEELLSLLGNTGAKHILQKYAEDVATVPFELGHIDIDTQTDYHNLTQTQ